MKSGDVRNAIIIIVSFELISDALKRSKLFFFSSIDSFPSDPSTPFAPFSLHLFRFFSNAMAPEAVWSIEMAECVVCTLLWERKTFQVYYLNYIRLGITYIFGWT